MASFVATTEEAGERRRRGVGKVGEAESKDNFVVAKTLSIYKNS